MSSTATSGDRSDRRWRQHQRDRCRRRRRRSSPAATSTAPTCGPPGERVAAAARPRPRCPRSSTCPKLGKGVQAVAIAPVGLVPVVRDVARPGASRRPTAAQRSIETSFAPAKSDANANFGKGFGDKMAVDPANPDVVLAGGPDTPLRISADGGATWTETTVPAGQPQRRISERLQRRDQAASASPASRSTRPRRWSTAGPRSSMPPAGATGSTGAADGGVTWTAIGGPDAVQHAVDRRRRAPTTRPSGDSRARSRIQRYDAGRLGRHHARRVEPTSRSPRSRTRSSPPARPSPGRSSSATPTAVRHPRRWRATGAR